MIARSQLLTALALTLTMVLVPMAPPLGAPAAADPTPPDVPDAAAWRHAADTGEPVPVVWKDRVLAVQVWDNDLVDPSGYPVIGVNGEAIDTTGIHALAGEVLGEASSTVRVTLSGDRIDGMILGVQGAPHLGFSTEDGTTVVATPADTAAGLPVPPQRIDDDTMPGTQVGGGCGVPVNTMGSPFGLVGGWPERTVDIAYPVDDAYANGIAGGDWLGSTVALANRLDGFYDNANDLRYSPVHIIRVSQSIFGAPTTNGYLANIASYYNANYDGLYRELVYLMSGTDFTNALGQASCIGGVGNGNSHYMTGWMLFEQQVGLSIGPFSVYSDASLKTIAHEVGHQMGVLHEQHNCVEAAQYYSPFEPAGACTTMAPYVDLHGLGFSTWSRLTSRGIADQRDL